MSTPNQPERFDDDMMAIADAVGVSLIPWREYVDHVPHPAHRHEFADDSLGAMLHDWSRASLQQDFDTLADQPIALVPAIDHALCEGEDCARVICACVDGPCAGTTEQACPHHELLCDEHRLECVDCVVDYIDGGDS